MKRPQRTKSISSVRLLERGVIAERKELYRRRAAFVRYFNRNRIRNMHIDDYVIGVGEPKTGYNFCYALERQLHALGSIIGATAHKFGVYYGRTSLPDTF